MWKFKLFEQLNTQELYSIFKLRVDTFVVEQQCAYPEIDEKDLTAVHLFRMDDGQLTAYARLIIDEQVHIGRVIVAPNARGRGLAKELMTEALNYIETHHPYETMHLQGQAHLEHFYGSFGFKATSDVYFEDMIPHIDMERPAFKADESR